MSIRLAGIIISPYAQHLFQQKEDGRKFLYKSPA